ncbi:MAG: DUF3368 domain-containing protein [Deltaproteobacteria bacterium]|nr:DUF3368 domain-containing protein [Deltaproteobacteria bacterium]
MPIERIVVNASPLICLFKSGLHDLLPQIFKHIVVPAAVIKEVTVPGKGTAGIVVLAKRRGLLPSLRDAFAKLSGSGLWLSRDLIEELCRTEGE